MRMLEGEFPMDKKSPFQLASVDQAGDDLF
jgi:hypothetical protein